jgi:hypothetical protein
MNDELNFNGEEIIVDEYNLGITPEDALKRANNGEAVRRANDLLSWVDDAEIYDPEELGSFKITEGSIYFYDDCLEARVYYSEVGTKWCKESKHLSELYRLMNYLNAKVWPRVKDGMNGTLYKSEHLITPRFCVTEDGCQDITTIMAIPYSHFELDVLEIEDFITAALPDLLDSLSASIFLSLLGEINVEEAISLVDTEILGRDSDGMKKAEAYGTEGIR